MIFRNVSIFFSLLLLLVSATTVQAVECFAPSPSVKNNIDVYEEIKTRKLTKAEYEQLSQLFTSIKGGWKGKAETVTCKGSQDAPRQDTVRYDVVSDVETGLSNSIMIKSELHSGEKKQNYQETLTYFLSPERLGVTDSSRAGRVRALLNVVMQTDSFVTGILSPNGWDWSWLFTPQGAPVDVLGLCRHAFDGKCLCAIAPQGFKGLAGLIQ